MNILFCSVGRRAEFLKITRKSMGSNGRIIATDITNTAPALYFADAFYLVPRITDPAYIDTILDICRKEKIQAISTCIDPEIMILAQHRKKFEEIGVLVLAPAQKTAEICFDKFLMYQHLVSCGVPTVRTYGDVDSFKKGLEEHEIAFPVFVKPRTGSGSVGARKVETMDELVTAFAQDASLIVQEYMGDAQDLDADVYIDTVSHKVVSAFTKKKLETKIGGASKTISFKDEKMVNFLIDALSHFEFNGPIDVDVFCRNGQYYLSEVNPRFGGAYLHAFGAGLDFIQMIQNNVNGIANAPEFMQYEEGIAMLMYDSVVICKLDPK
jgi:carbamoyl-phosphate synthase large subunit